MEAGSLDGHSARCSRQAWRLAAWMVILQPAVDSKWVCVDFMDLGVFWGRKLGGLRHGITTGLDGSRAPIRTLQSWDPHKDWMTR